MSTPPRIPLVEPGTRPELAAIEHSILAERGRISELYRALLNSPPIAEGWDKLLTAVRNRTLIPPALRELAILRVAVLNAAPYEFDAHVPHALNAGLTREQIAGVETFAAGDRGEDRLFNDDAQLALELTDAMTRDVVVPDALMDRVRRRFDPRGIVELVTTIAAYNMVSRFLAALEIGPLRPK
jgi:AhpD family alkylhydroperoxidase